MRDLVGKREVVWKNYDQVMDILDKVIASDPDIHGIIGYSEGAAMASTYILDEERRYNETGRERRIKSAMFITGWPPMNPKDGILLADESDVMIDVPTLHVVGANGTVILDLDNAIYPSRPRANLFCVSVRSIPSWRLRIVQCLRPRHGHILRYGQGTHHPAVWIGDPGVGGRRAGLGKKGQWRRRRMISPHGISHFASGYNRQH